MNHNIIIKEGDCDYDNNYDSNSRAVISDIAINHTTGTSSSPSTLYSVMKMDINTNNLEIKEGLCNDGNSSMKSRSISGSSVSDVASSPSTCSSSPSTSTGLKNIETSTSRRNSRTEQNSQSSSNSNTIADSADASSNTRTTTTTTTTKAQQLLMIENEGLRIKCAEDKRKIEQLEEQNEDLLLELASIKMSAFTGGSPTTSRVATTNRGSVSGAADDTDLSSTNRRGKPQRQNSIGGEFSRADGRHTSTRRATIGDASNNDTSRARVDNKDKDLSVMKKIKPRRRISQLRCVSMHNGHGRRQSNISTDDSDPSSDEFGGDDGGGGGTSTTRSILRSRSGSGTRPALTRTFSRRVDRRASACSGDMLRHHNQDNDNDNNYGSNNQDDGMPRLKRTFSRRVVRNKSLSDVETLLSSSSTNMNIDGNIDGNSANSTFNNNNRSATRTTRRESQQSSVRTNRRRSSRNLLGSSSMHGPGDSIHCPDDGDCTRRISASSKDLLRMFNEE